MLFLEPRVVASLSRDPDAAWRMLGWRLLPRAQGLEVHGPSRHPLRVDGVTITRETTIPYAPDHRIEVGVGLFRMVRTQRAPVEPGRWEGAA